MKTYKSTAKDYDYKIDNLGWMVQIKHKGADIEKFKCGTCGKISTDKTEICTVKN